ncbi:hypothetical protein BRADI_3g44865v3, partial [Brachypodium distachyon]
HTITCIVSFPPNVSFRRNLVGPKLLEWTDLLTHLTSVNLSPEHDEFHWNLHPSCSFSLLIFILPVMLLACLGPGYGVLYSCTHWLRTWSILLKPADRQLALMACNQLKQVGRDIFTHDGRRSSLHLEAA